MLISVRLSIFLILDLILAVRFQILFWRLLFEQFLFLPSLTWRRLFRPRFLNYTFSVWYVAYMTRSLTNMTYPIIERYSIIFIHTDTNKWIRWSIFLSIWTTLLICLERINTFSVNFFHLVLRYIFDWKVRSWSIVFPFLSICFVVILFDEIVVIYLQLLGFRNSITFIILMALNIDIVLDIWQLWLIILVLGACLGILYRHIWLHVSIIESLYILFLFIIRHVNLTIKRRFT